RRVLFRSWLTPLLVAVLSVIQWGRRRSDESTRGTGLAYFSVAFAVGMILGASGGGLLYPWLGFHGLLGAGALLCGLGVLALVADVNAMRTPAGLRLDAETVGRASP